MKTIKVIDSAATSDRIKTMYQASGGLEKKVIVDQAMVLEQTMGCQV